MILVLDACTVSNLLHVFQDDSLIKSLPKAFDEIYIAEEVFAEIHTYKDIYRPYYKDNWNKLDEVYKTISLATFLKREQASKLECKPIIKSYLNFNNFPLKENGEFYSSIVALTLSRNGENHINTHKILFATDDDKAGIIYQGLYKLNQVGSIISSIDILIILWLKGEVRAAKVNSYIEGLYPLYSQPINKIKTEIVKVRKREKDDSLLLALNTLDELVCNGEYVELSDAIGEVRFNKIFKKYENLKTALKLLPLQELRDKVNKLAHRQKEFAKNLVWKLENSN